MGPAHVENVAELACRTALSRRGVAHITFPVDIQDFEVEAPSKRNVPGHTSDVGPSIAPAVPDESELRAAADSPECRQEDGHPGRPGRHRRAGGAGGGGGEAWRADHQAAARQRRAFRTTALTRRAAIGLLGTLPSQEALESCDTLLMVGTSFPYIEFMPKPGQARAVQIDIDPARIGLRYPVEVGLVGAARHTLQALLPMLERQGRPELPEEGAEGHAGVVAAHGGARHKRMHAHEAAGRRLGARQALADDAIVISDSGTIATWFARQIPVTGAARCTRSPATWRPWRAACHTPSQPRSPIRSGSASPSSATAASSMLMAELGDLREVRPAGQDRRHQEQHPRPDQVGADGLPRQPRVRRRPAAHRLRQGGRGLRRQGLPRRGPGASAAPRSSSALDSRGPCVIEAVVDPLEPPMPAKDRHATRRQSSPSR